VPQRAATAALPSEEKAAPRCSLAEDKGAGVAAATAPAVTLVAALAASLEEADTAAADDAPATPTPGATIVAGAVSKRRATSKSRSATDGAGRTAASLS